MYPTGLETACCYVPITESITAVTPLFSLTKIQNIQVPQMEQNLLINLPSVPVYKHRIDSIC
jgi:hypothetical protein